MSNRYNPSLQSEFSEVPTKKKYLRCLGCDVMGRRSMWKELITELRNSRKNGTAPSVSLYLCESGAVENRRIDSLHVYMTGVQSNAQVGYLSREDTNAILPLLKAGCSFRLDVADYNRVGEREIPLVMTYTMPEAKEKDSANSAAEEPADYKHDNIQIPFIKDYACEIPFARVELIDADSQL